MSQIRNHLEALGLETPMTESGISDGIKKQSISESFREIMSTLGLDLSDDSLSGTPDRVAKMYIEEIFCGLDYKNFPRITTIENKMNVDQMVLCNDISMSSTCEHHFVVIDGLAKVAYIPAHKIIGLSKINRIVRFFAQRPQVQERLTQQIAEALKFILETDNVAVQIAAVHHCVKSRGVMDSSSSTTTSSLSGAFLEQSETRAEFYNA